MEEHIKSLKNKSTSDTKVIALKAIINCKNFTEIFATILNTSLKEGVVPTQLKQAKIAPIHKSGNKNDVSNYRPISLLPTFSKIFEKALHGRITGFLQKNNSLYNCQFGFRKRHSSEHALLTAQNSILQSLDKKHIAMLLLIDFSKAFDMVDHQILLHKLAHYGIRGVALKWLTSYLHNRQQRVHVNNAQSDCQNLIHGIPQGSILGPLLFIIYINDMPNVQKLAKFILYADDANIIITGTNAHEIITKYNELSDHLSNWVASNGLMLNVRKTNYMIFSNINIGQLSNLKPTINNIPIERKKTAKFLGVFVDEKLSWSHHINTICTKISKNTGILYKMKGILPQKAMLTLFHSFIQSHLNYCSLIWGLGSKNSIKKLFICQKKAIRTLIPGFVNYYYNTETEQQPAHTKETFTKHNIPTVYSQILKNVMLFMYKIIHFPQLLPHAIISLFPQFGTDSTVENDTSHEISQRLATQVNSLFVKGPRLHNEITIEATEKHKQLHTNTLNSYKNSIKSYLIDIQSEGDSVVWTTENFRLCTQKATRKSPRTNQIDGDPEIDTITI